MPTLRILHDDGETTLNVEKGANLRRTLLEADYSPYVPLTRIANCGGRGLCATCGVWIETDGPHNTPQTEPAPAHWHDKLAARFGYPRLSCQISIDDDMTVRIPDKIIWGKRDPQRRYTPPSTPD